jgi:15-cis-phytoene synthase
MVTDSPADEVRLIARTWAPDHYLAALLAPPAVRADLIALAAFLGDVERIIATVSDPALAEIRLQWWREAIDGAGRGERTGAVIADALGEAIRRHALPTATFDDMLEARSFDLYADPLPDAAAFDAYLVKADGAPFVLAAMILGLPAAPVQPLIRAAADAYGRARLLRTTAAFTARGRDPFAVARGDGRAAPAPIAEARAAFAMARAAWRTAAAPVRTACLPLAVVGPYLDATQGSDFDATRMVADVAPLTRVWRLFVSHTTGRC